MKTQLLSKLSLVFLIVLLLCSCKKDEPETVIDSRDSFVGSWNVSDQLLTKANYQVRIFKDENNSEKVWLINFHGTSDTAFGYISSKDITITPQVLSATHLNTGGSGLMNGTTTINFQYYINDGAQQDTMIATYQK